MGLSINASGALIMRRTVAGRFGKPRLQYALKYTLFRALHIVLALVVLKTRSPFQILEAGKGVSLAPIGRSTYYLSRSGPECYDVTLKWTPASGPLVPCR